MSKHKKHEHDPKKHTVVDRVKLEGTVNLVGADALRNALMTMRRLIGVIEASQPAHSGFGDGP